ncbi:MAG TPA: AI-2E family transporter YdiK [Terriglobia bacterium]|nr:AI-2E family transporter YdiK [Terriglobia bacterium]
MEENVSVRRDVTHTILSVLFILLLIASSFWILRPFLISIVWGTIIVVASWPLKERLQKLLGNRRGLAVSFMTAALLLMVLTPLMFAVLTIARNAENISAQIRSFDIGSLVSPPPWLEHIPLAGKKLADRWAAFAALSPEERSQKVSPYAQRALWWFVARAGGTGVTIVNFLLTMAIAIILYAKGETCREGLLRFARRLAGVRGEEVAVLAGKAVRGVVLGVVVTALTQAAIGGVGLFIAGVPAAALLAAVMFILCLAQLGPLLVLLPSVVWLYWSGQAVWGTVLLIFTIVAGTIDNFLKPFLIKKGADLPLLLILSGVIGGLIAFGVIGLFIAPVILAIAYTLLKEWVSEDLAVTGQVDVVSERVS